MSTDRDPTETEALLAELGWVRQLAWSLVRDEAEAADLTQEALLAALRTPPPDAAVGPRLRAWLGTVTRNLHRSRLRGERRRERREETVARPERDDSRLVEAVVLRRDLADAVLALAEPYRATLLRYYYEQRSAAEIATLMDCSEAAVRQRLVRARSQVRERLAPTYGDGESGWRRALLVLTEPGADRGGPGSTVLPWAWSAAGLVALLVGVQLWVGRTAPPVPALLPPVEYAYQPPVPPLVPDRRAALARGGLASWLVVPAPRSLGATTRGASDRVGTAGALPEALLGLARDDELSKELSDDLTREVSDAQPVEALPEPLLARVAKHADVPVERIRGTELFRARVAQRGEEQPVECIVVRAPLAPDADAGRLTVLVVEGRAIGLGLFGRPEFEADPDLRWAVFLGQLMSVQETGPALDLTRPGKRALEDLLRGLETRTDPDGRLAAAYLQQRRVMRGHGMVGRARSSLAETGATPPPEWYGRLAERLRGLAERSLEFEVVLGEEGARTHAALAQSGADAFDQVERALRDGSPDAIESAFAAQRNACSACHRAPSTLDVGTQFFDAFDPFAEHLDLPRGHAVVGLDLGPAPGDDGQLSAQVSEAFRRALVLASALD